MRRAKRRKIKPPTLQKFTSGSGTYLTPSGCLYIKVKIVGGGGAGGASGTGTYGTSTAGGNTTFGTAYLTANGGGLGARNNSFGSGGTASLDASLQGTTLNGGNGCAGEHAEIATVFALGGVGGTTVYGGGGSGTANVAGGAGAGYGAGGGGAGGVGNVAGMECGAGGGSGAYVEAIIPRPSSSYSYAIGAGGIGGTAGTSGFAGGNGAAGYIEVTEVYS